MNKILECCTLCPRRCKVNRKKSKKRYCNTAYKPIISSYQRDFGEDNELMVQEPYSSQTVICISSSTRTIKSVKTMMEKKSQVFENIPN